MILSNLFWYLYYLTTAVVNLQEEGYLFFAIHSDSMCHCVPTPPGGTTAASATRNTATAMTATVDDDDDDDVE